MASSTQELPQADELQKSYTVVDLFAGAGGITAGFCFDLGSEYPAFDPPFISVLAIDNNKPACETYEANFGKHAISDKIEHIQTEQMPNGSHRFYNMDSEGRELTSVALSKVIDVVVGGPPCQGFSPLGRMNNWNREDPRNSLWQYFMKIVKTLRPSIFLLENVPQLLTSRQGQAILDEAHELGYYLATPGVLDASLYGVPQKRRRAFILGSRIGPVELPKPTGKRCSVEQAFETLPDSTDDVLNITRNPTALSRERYHVIPPGGNRFDLMRERPDITPRCWLEKKTGSTDVFGRLWSDRPASTIRTQFYKPEKGRYLHPTEDRSITHREAAVLQTFPNNFTFKGSKIEIAKQIGNAVPPVLAYHIACVIHERLQNPEPGTPNPTPNLEELRRAKVADENGHAESVGSAAQARLGCL